VAALANITMKVTAGNKVAGLNIMNRFGEGIVLGGEVSGPSKPVMTRWTAAILSAQAMSVASRKITASGGRVILLGPLRPSGQDVSGPRDVNFWPSDIR